MAAGRPKVKVFHSRGYPSKICPSCKAELPLIFFAPDKSKSSGVTSHCKRCRSSAKQFRRALGIEGETRSYKKDHAYAMYVVRELLRIGTIVKPDICDLCHMPHEKIEAHHPDYSKPAEFVWLCKNCHARAHRKDVVDRMKGE